MQIAAQRAREYAKYAHAYSRPDYGMGLARAGFAQSLLAEAWADLAPGSLLDVGAGRGEMLTYSSALGFDVTGTEVVDGLCRWVIRFGEAHALPFPDDCFDVVVCLDVLEHLLPGDTPAALHELFRVARRRVIVSAASYSSVIAGPGGEPLELHINRRSADAWDALITDLAPPGAHVSKRERAGCASPHWVINLEAPL